MLDSQRAIGAAEVWTSGAGRRLLRASFPAYVWLGDC